LPELLAEE
jgi:hypothetical protein